MSSDLIDQLVIQHIKEKSPSDLLKLIKDADNFYNSIILAIKCDLTYLTRILRSNTLESLVKTIVIGYVTDYPKVLQELFFKDANCDIVQTCMSSFVYQYPEIVHHMDQDDKEKFIIGYVKEYPILLWKIISEGDAADILPTIFNRLNVETKQNFITDYIFNDPDMFNHVWNDRSNKVNDEFVKKYLKDNPRILDEISSSENDLKEVSAESNAEAEEYVYIPPEETHAKPKIDLKAEPTVSLHYKDRIVKIQELDDIHISLLISQSTRMYRYRDLVYRAVYNFMISQQIQKNGTCDITVFDEVSTLKYNGNLVGGVNYIIQKNYNLYGEKQNLSKALFELMTRDLPGRLGDKIPKIFVVIITDNDSDKHSASDYKAYCKSEIQKSKWNFIIVGTDATGEGNKLGINREQCFTSEFMISNDFNTALIEASNYIIAHTR